MKILVLYSYEEKSQNVPEGKIGTADLAIVETLRLLGHDVEFRKIDFANVPYADDYDVVFNMCDSFDYSLDEPRVPRGLRTQGVAYTGNDAETILLCNDKSICKEFLIRKGVRTPQFQVFESAKDQLNCQLRFPLIVKPVHEDASNGIDEDSVVFDEERLRKKVIGVIELFNQPALVEEYIDGREFCVPVIGNENPQVLPVLEIDYSEAYFENKPKHLSFKAKWSKQSNAFKNTYSIVAKDVPSDLRKRIEETAKKAYLALRMHGYGSVDMRVDNLGNVFVLEVNPNCYIAPEADSVKAAKAAGLEYPIFLQKIAQLALARKQIEVILQH
ncbi:MAG: ATP-grasp domain-containing protein [Nanoarchaeota archaeon]